MKTAAIWKVVYPWMRNKYILTIAIFLLWMFMFDSSNWIVVYHEYQKINKFEREQEYYIQKIENDRKRLNELRTNNENLEKFAREQYLMKKHNEDIFVIMPD